jgi:hypothetical protein
MGAGEGRIPGVKRPQLGADHSAQLVAEVTNVGAISRLSHTFPSRGASLI